jgi:hypothetical protein
MSGTPLVGSASALDVDAVALGAAAVEDCAETVDGSSKIAAVPRKIFLLCERISVSLIFIFFIYL